MVQSSQKYNQLKTLIVSSSGIKTVKNNSKKIKKVVVADQASHLLKQKTVAKNMTMMQKQENLNCNKVQVNQNQ